MSHRFTELMDAAQEQQEANNRAAQAKVQTLAAPEHDPDFDGIHCIDGGERIPKARLALGKIRCVRCQEIKEQQQKQKRK